MALDVGSFLAVVPTRPHPASFVGRGPVADNRIPGGLRSFGSITDVTAGSLDWTPRLLTSDHPYRSLGTQRCSVRGTPTHVGSSCRSGFGTWLWFVVAGFTGLPVSVSACRIRGLPLAVAISFVPDCVGATVSLLDDRIRQRRPHEMPIEELADHLAPPLDSGRTCQDGGDASGLVP